VKRREEIERRTVKLPKHALHGSRTALAAHADAVDVFVF